MNTKTKTKQRGAVLLIAILVSSVVLVVGFGVYQRTYKEILIGSFWKQIQIAFSAADAGLECAVYWDKQIPSGSGTANCFEVSFPWSINQPTDNPLNVTQESTYPGQGFTLAVQGGCVDLRVIKVNDPTADFTAPPIKWTYIEAAGYNDCNPNNPRRVERIRWIKYKDQP